MPQITPPSKRPPPGLALWRGLRMKCPACGQGEVFRAYLKPVDVCAACGEPLGQVPSEDGPAWLTVLGLAPVLVAVTFLVSLSGLPLWVTLPGAAVVVTELASGRQRLVREADVGADPLAELVEKVIRSGKSGISQTPEGEVFLNAHLPPARIVSIGAVHISQTLAPMAKIAGFDFEIIDPRTAFASEERFPGATLHAEWPEDVLKERPFDAYTAVCVITHDPKIDDFPLISALKTGCFYIGALGSRKTHAKRVERLKEAGIPQASIDRIKAPIGADIGAATPGEIAVAILASVIEAFRKRKMFADRRGETEPQ